MFSRNYSAARAQNQEELYSHYDQTVGNRTVRGPTQSEASVLKLPESERGLLSLFLVGGDLCSHDPFLGAQATLRGICEKPSLYWRNADRHHRRTECQLHRVTQWKTKTRAGNSGPQSGIEALEIPVTGGNVSLYNESPVGPIPPNTNGWFNRTH